MDTNVEATKFPGRAQSTGRAKCNDSPARPLNERKPTRFPASSNNVGAVWRSQSVSLSRFAGQTITLRFEAADGQSNGGTVIEAGFDNVIVNVN